MPPRQPSALSRGRGRGGVLARQFPARGRRGEQRAARPRDGRGGGRGAWAGAGASAVLEAGHAPRDARADGDPARAGEPGPRDGGGRGGLAQLDEALAAFEVGPLPEAALAEAELSYG